MTIKDDVLKEVEKQFLKIRGWKDWEEYDRVGKYSELDKNIREELMNTTIKATTQKICDEIKKLIDECLDLIERKENKDCWCEPLYKLQSKIKGRN